MISIVLPVYNPAPGWSAVIQAESARLRALRPEEQFEIIVVNDGSTSPIFHDEKQSLAGAVRLLEYYPNKGKGEALRTGVRASTGELIVYTDIDFPYTMESLLCIIDALRDQMADIVIGVKDPGYYSHVPPVRRLISRFLRMLIRLFFRIPTDDTQCGLKGFNQRAKSVFLQTTIQRYLFDLEFIFIASRSKNVTLKTQPVQLREGVQFRRMDFGIIKNELWNFMKIFLKAI